ncbi:MAG: transcription elongation factor GreA [Solirubrobacterales bacterium]|nr:transcription elongation factor GreA [Solirubrobacterales bacterium]
MADPRESEESITADGMAKLKEELTELEGPARQRLAVRLKAARELGDLKENAEYHIAKEDQAHLETRIKRLRTRLDNAVVSNPDGAEGDVFAFGRTAELTDDRDQSHRWTLVGSTEADLSRGLLSAESPIGKALRDRRTGDEVTVAAPKGDRVFRIERIL